MFDFMITAIDLPAYHLDTLLVNEPTAIKYVIYMCFKPFPGSFKRSFYNVYTNIWGDKTIWYHIYVCLFSW